MNSERACLTAIVGYPGSGESFLIDECTKNDAKLFADHDFLKNSVSALCQDAPKLNELVEALKGGREAIVADIHFMIESKRQEFETLLLLRIPEVRTRWKFFENNADQCRANLLALGGDVSDRLAGIERFRRDYHIPDGAEMLPVYVASGNSVLSDLT